MKLLRPITNPAFSLVAEPTCCVWIGSKAVGPTGCLFTGLHGAEPKCYILLILTLLIQIATFSLDYEPNCCLCISPHATEPNCCLYISPQAAEPNCCDFIGPRPIAMISLVHRRGRPITCTGTALRKAPTSSPSEQRTPSNRTFAMGLCP